SELSELEESELSLLEDEELDDFSGFDSGSFVPIATFLSLLFSTTSSSTTSRLVTSPFSYVISYVFTTLPSLPSVFTFDSPFGKELSSSSMVSYGIFSSTSSSSVSIYVTEISISSSTFSSNAG